jgi:hypothetical protein
MKFILYFCELYCISYEYSNLKLIIWKFKSEINLKKNKRNMTQCRTIFGMRPSTIGSALGPIRPTAGPRPWARPSRRMVTVLWPRAAAWPVAA